MNCVNCKTTKGLSTLNGYCEKCFDTCFQLFPREAVGAKAYYYQVDEQGNKKEFWL